MNPLKLKILSQSLTIIKLRPKTLLPTWLESHSWYSVTHTADELSIVCERDKLSKDIPDSGEWRGIMVCGPLDFSLTGILLQLAEPLAQAGISIFAISTFDSDYVLVQRENLAGAINSLRESGHIIEED